MADVFISYARDDNEKENNEKGLITELAGQLEAAGKQVWIDYEDIPLGENFVDTFKDGLDKSDVVISVLSSRYMASKNCRVELGSFFI